MVIFYKFDLLYSINSFDTNEAHLRTFTSCADYENTSMQHTAIFQYCKNNNFHLKVFDFFHIFAQNIVRGYVLEPPNSNGYKEYPQSMF